MFEILGSDPWLLPLIIAVAFVAGIIHGAIGMVGGLIMTGVIAHFIGIKPTVPVITCALIFSHLSRGYLLRKNVDFWAVRHVLLFGLPTVIAGSVFFGYLSPRVIALIFGSVLTISVPIKYWARKNSIKTGPKLLAGASVVWGGLAGNVIGPGFFLAPFLMGTGMNRLAFVGTLATITLVMNLIKISVFGFTDLLTPELIILGIIAGLSTIPGNYLGHKLLKKMSDGTHEKIIDVMTLILVSNFFYLAFTY
ncbi:MAG: sulfite exporter TauE/SafE family protein [Gammaproteobacteria bacterium]|jgi:uncharacterized protein|nr:sulfite exporter TauE/SafE family protein [Gammaproteobacteria bacterium]